MQVYTEAYFENHITMNTYDHVKSILGDKTDEAIRLAQNLLELQLKLKETQIPSIYIDEYGRRVMMTKFGVSVLKKP